jgi:signal transduction histidine kinase
MILRRRWYWVDWSLFIILIGWFVTGMAYMLSSSEDFPGNTKLIFGIGMLICFLTPLLFWRPNYTNLALFPISVLVTSGSLQIYLVYTLQDPFNILYCPIMVVGFLSDRKYVWWTAPIFTLGFPITNIFLLEDSFNLGHFFNDCMNGALFFGMGICLQRVFNNNEKAEKLLAENQRQYQLIHEQNNALEQYANQIEQLTLLEERNRMARELHDTVGHTFTSVIMGMDAVSYLIEVSPDKAKEKLDVLRNVTRTGLEEVRRSIHQMAPQGDDMLLSQQLARLANEFALHTGTQVSTVTQGDEYELPKQLKLTMIRCLQESLTNAKRHGRASTVEVVLSYEPSQIVLKVEDDGIGSTELKMGFGISSMQERITALQGVLEVTSSAGQGTTVLCAIPTRRMQSL